MLSCWILLVCVAWDEPGVRLTLPDGEVLRPSALSLEVDRCSYTLGEELRECALEDLWELEFLASAEERAPDPASVVHLHDGSFLAGSVAGGDEDFLHFDLGGSTRVELSLDAVAAVFFGPRATTSAANRFPRRDGNDMLYRRQEVGGDFTSGTLIRFADEGLEFEYSLGDGTFPYDELEAVFLSMQIDLEPLDAPRIELDVHPEGTIRGTFVAMTGQGVSILPLFAEQPTLFPLADLRAVRFEAGSATWLSDLEPAVVEQTPFLGGRDEFLYPYRRDRTVTGLPLQMAGRFFPKGFGCHTRTQLEFELPAGEYSHFRVWCGLSDEVRDLSVRGSIEFVVLLDGEERFRSVPMSVADPPQRIEIPLGGASRLALLADFAADADVGDRGIWGAPVLWSE